jgi:hypothetical protein
MNQNIEDPGEQNRTRLIGLALAHLQLEAIASAVIPIPGGDRVIAIGTPAQVRALLDPASASGGELAFTNDGRELDWGAYAAAEAIGCGGTGKLNEEMPCLGCDACPREAAPVLARCAAGRDGECSHVQCPQLRDNEPRATGRHCPLDNLHEE